MDRRIILAAIVAGASACSRPDALAELRHARLVATFYPGDAIAVTVLSARGEWWQGCPRLGEDFRGSAAGVALAVATAGGEDPDGNCVPPSLAGVAAIDPASVEVVALDSTRTFALEARDVASIAPSIGVCSGPEWCDLAAPGGSATLPGG